MTAYAQEGAGKVVRVGWYDSSYNTVDDHGRRSGYAYEYQLKIAAYTGWSYEYVNGSWSDLLQMLVDGKIDLMSDVKYTDERAKNMLFPDFAMGEEESVCKVGSSDFFFAVNKNRPDLLSELNGALSSIHNENRHFNHEMYEQFINTSGANAFLSGDEMDWLAEHGPIRVGYQDNYMAFCAKDPQTGELTGVLKDWLDAASENVENAELTFEPVCFPTAAAAMEAMQAGEVDCVFPANLTNYDGEMRDVFLSPALMRTDMSAVVRESDKRDFASREHVTVAVSVDNPNYDLFLVDNFPDWCPIYFDDTQECLRAVADGQADCLLISNYRYNNISRLCEQLRLTTWSTGVEMDYCLAVNRSQTTLCSILSKASAIVPSSTVNAALMYYSTEDARTSVADSLLSMLPGILTAVLVVAALVVLVSCCAVRGRTRTEMGPDRTLPARRTLRSLTTFRARTASIA